MININSFIRINHEPSLFNHIDRTALAMSQGNTNVSISSLLDSSSNDDESKNHNDNEQLPPTVIDRSSNRQASSVQNPIPLQQWVSKFQTVLDFAPGSQSPNLPIINGGPAVATHQVETPWTFKTPEAPLLPARTEPVAKKLPNIVPKTEQTNTSFHSKGVPDSNLSDRVKQFQTNFQINEVAAHQSKTSIMSIINAENGPNFAAEPDKSKEKKPIKKKGSEDESSANKRRKKDKALNQVQPATKTSSPGSPSVDDPSKKKNSKSKTGGKPSDPKKPAKGKKKDLDSKSPSEEAEKQKSKALSSTITTHRQSSNTTEEPLLLPAPSIIEIKDQGSKDETSGNNVSEVEEKIDQNSKVQEQTSVEGENAPSKQDNAAPDSGDAHVHEDKEKEKEKTREKEKEKEKEKEREKEAKKEKEEAPIIALQIPLLNKDDPKPGKAEVIVNAMKLAEEKYGWAIIHPNAKSALDMMDELIDEDDDGVEEDPEEEELPINEDGNDGETVNQANASSNASKKKKDTEEELTEEQLARRHEAKMNRKVGKYDYEDPFIDDEELQWEEEITSTKEGFFVYWGPLVDDRNANKGKNVAKNKK